MPALDRRKVGEVKHGAPESCTLGGAPLLDAGPNQQRGPTPSQVPGLSVASPRNRGATSGLVGDRLFGGELAAGAQLVNVLSDALPGQVE